jgi:membrane-associated phospholipid phosphatase
MKYAFDRRRPYDKYPSLIHPSGREDSPSFPSTHTATAFALATSLSIRYPKWQVIVPSAVWATSVGFARMNQGGHSPTDVLAGAALGVGCAFVNVYVNRWLARLIQ